MKFQLLRAPIIMVFLLVNPKALSLGKSLNVLIGHPHARQ